MIKQTIYNAMIDDPEIRRVVVQFSTRVAESVNLDSSQTIITAGMLLSRYGTYLIKLTVLHAIADFYDQRGHFPKQSEIRSVLRGDTTAISTAVSVLVQDGDIRKEGKRLTITDTGRELIANNPIK